MSFLGGSLGQAGTAEAGWLSGTVTVATNTTLGVVIDGGTVALNALLGFDGVLAVNDRVWVVKQGSTLLIVARQNQVLSPLVTNRVNAYRSAAFTTVVGDNIMAYDTELIDLGSNFTTGASANYVVPRSGWIRVTAVCTITPTAAAQRWYLRLNKGGAGWLNMGALNNDSISATPVLGVAEYVATVGDVLTVILNAPAANATSVGVGQASNWVSFIPF